MHNIQDPLPIQIISIYKHIVMTKRKETHYRDITAKSICKKIEKEIRFYIDFIMPK